MPTDNNRVPLDIAQEILGTFGITEPTPAYERWVKPEGFDRGDLWTVVAESRFVFNVDWRAALPEELALIASALGELGAELAVDVADDADDGWISCGDRCAAVKYRPSDGDDFTDVIRAVQRVVPETIEFRASPDNGDNDGWVFASLLREEWAKLESLDAPFLTMHFERLSPSP